MIRRLGLSLLLLSFILTSCNKQEEKQEIQTKLNESTCRVGDEILRSSTYPSNFSEDFHKQALMTVIDIYNENYKGEAYIKRTINTVDNTVNISIIKNGFGTPVHDGQPNVDRTIWSGTDEFFAQYMYNLNHYFASEPCQFEIIIFEMDGVYYVEDCC